MASQTTRSHSEVSANQSLQIHKFYHFKGHNIGFFLNHQVDVGGVVITSKVTKRRARRQDFDLDLTVKVRGQVF